MSPVGSPVTPFTKTRFSAATTPLMIGFAPSGSNNSCRSISIPTPLQALDHANAGVAGRWTFDTAQNVITLMLVKLRCLKCDCVEHGCRAPTALRFGLRCFNDLRADLLPSQCF